MHGDTYLTPGEPQTPFEEIRKETAEGFDYWLSRDLAQVLDYAEYRNFESVLQKARLACLNSGQKDRDHFVEFNDMIEVGKGAQREIKNVRLSRYACYLVIQNANPSKEIVAHGQTYFAVQTRRQELEDDHRLMLREELETHNKHLASAAQKAGVAAPLDYAIFQNHGYMGLYGGLTAKDIGKRKGLKKGKHILDHMGSTELAANLFRATQTEEKIRRENISGKDNANRTHLEVGQTVRKTIHEIGGTSPENLPTVSDVKKLARSRQKEIINNNKEPNVLE